MQETECGDSISGGDKNERLNRIFLSERKKATPKVALAYTKT